MQAVRIHRFGPPDVVVIDDIPVPAPSLGEVLVRVQSAGVAPWDALIREGKSAVSPRPPLTLGSDLSGSVDAVGPDITQFHVGQEIYGVTNPQFCGAQAEFAIASAKMIAPKPPQLTHDEAASAPVIAVTASQMLFEYGRVRSGETALILGAAGNVGAYLLQFAAGIGVHAIAVARSSEAERVLALDAQSFVDSSSPGAERSIPPVDIILDTIGGPTLERFFPALRTGGRLVSVVSTALPQRADVTGVFFYAEVTTSRLQEVASAFATGRISPRVGAVLPLPDARTAHYMLAGAPHPGGKIVLRVPA